MQDIEQRLNKVEWVQQAHTTDLSELRAVTTDFKMSLHKIESTLSQIKWFVLGALAFYASKELGLSVIIKGLIG